MAIHADMSHNMHGSHGPVGEQRFLAWHRAYLSRFEKAMRKIDGAAFVPYWDWLADPKVPSWLSSFKPTVDVPGFGKHKVARSKPRKAEMPSASDWNQASAQATFTGFTQPLENMHGWVHMEVGRGGKTMSDIMISPADPVFWMHHAQIDRLWSQWQAANPGQNPTLSGTDRKMDPWSNTETGLRKISKLGYKYGP